MMSRLESSASSRLLSRALRTGCFFVAVAVGGSSHGTETDASKPSVTAWRSGVATAAVKDDADDPAIWIDPADPSRSLILGTNKAAAPNGALVVFDLAGKIVQTIDQLDRPNNVDVQQDVELAGKTVDLAAVTERNQHAVRLYAIDRKTGQLNPIATAPVFEGEQGDFASPMGIGLYHRKPDGALFAIVGRKNGPTDGYLWQYRVETGGKLQLVRKFGRFSGTGEIEAIVVDDANDVVYYADEKAGIRKYHADPDHPDAAKELALFGTTGYRGDREGLAIYSTGERTGYLISTDQIEHSSRFILYRREGTATNPNDHHEIVGVMESDADSTDGIEVVSTPLGDAFPRGLLVAMNSDHRNFLYFAWLKMGD